MLRLFPNWISGLPTKQPDSGSRCYRERLHLNWGIVDVDDCINGAKYLVAQGLVDQKRVVISGSSTARGDGGLVRAEKCGGDFKDRNKGAENRHHDGDGMAGPRNLQFFSTLWRFEQGQRNRTLWKRPVWHTILYE